MSVDVSNTDVPDRDFGYEPPHTISGLV